MVRYCSSVEAAAIDEYLMGEKGGFKLEQLMELAGLACAQAVAKSYPRAKKVLAICGPGNQGGDGLVAARHLWHLGYQPSLYYPKEGKNEFYQSLKHQALNLGIPQIQESDFQRVLDESEVVLDAIFGFSFKGDVRPPFNTVIDALNKQQGKVPVVSVDIPSSWDVDEGNVSSSFTPEVLVSLTAPKSGARQFKGRHWLGGRFVPPSVDCRTDRLCLCLYSALEKKYDLQLPVYPGLDQIVEI